MIIIATTILINNNIIAIILSIIITHLQCVKKGVCLPPSFSVSTYTSALNFLYVFTVLGADNTCPRRTSSLFSPLYRDIWYIHGFDQWMRDGYRCRILQRLVCILICQIDNDNHLSSTPTLSPACPKSKDFLNISTPTQQDIIIMRQGYDIITKIIITTITMIIDYHHHHHYDSISSSCANITEQSEISWMEIQLHGKTLADCLQTPSFSLTVSRTRKLKHCTILKFLHQVIIHCIIVTTIQNTLHNA